MTPGRTRRFCDICRRQVDDVHHNDSAVHRFHFKLWEFNRYKKALAKDREGITMKIEPVTGRNEPQVDFKIKQQSGKHTAFVQMNQIMLHNNTVRFKCKIKNTGDAVYCIKDRTFFFASSLYTIIDNNCDEDNQKFFEGPDKNVPYFPPGEEYEFTIQYRLNALTPGSNKIHVACNFQSDTIPAPIEFAIIKSIVVNVVNRANDEIDEEISPYQSEKWTNITTVHKPMKQRRYPEKYCIPHGYLELLKDNLKRREYTEREGALFLQLRQQLGSYNEAQLHNYVDYWHTLLWLEELAQMRMLQQYNMSNVTVTVKNSKIIILEVRGLEEKRPSVIVGDTIKLRLHSDHTVYEGIVKYVREKTVEIFDCHDELFDYLELCPDAKMDVNFVLSRLTFERCHEGIDKLLANKQIPLLFSPIIPKPHRIVHPIIQFYNPNIMQNPEQRRAVEMILNSQQIHPYIVFGPPGTGKTMTIVEAILQLKRLTKRQILVCAPANSACDNITEKLIPYCTPDELIRVHSDTRERLSISELLLKYSNVDGDDVFKKIDIRKYRIVVTTLTLIGRYRDFKPDCVFIDEAAQAAEPTAAIALGVLSVGKQIVLAGDPKQLGPMCLSESAKKYGFELSLLERLMNLPEYRTYNPQFITMLRLNYRSHTDILTIPNALFYGNQLRTVLQQNDPLTAIPIYPRIYRHRSQQRNGFKYGAAAIEFCGIMAKERKDGASPSFFNPAEVSMVVDYVKTMLSAEFPIQVSELDIGIVTPYKRQVYKIKNQLVRSNWKNIEVGTTESFQGREKRIIIISTVRAQHCYLKHDRKYDLGFVKNEKRFNVAMTRAKSKLIVIGCPQVLGYDDKWLKFMRLCQQKNTHFGTQFQQRNNEVYDDIFNKMEHFTFS